MLLQREINVTVSIKYLINTHTIHLYSQEYISSGCSLPIKLQQHPKAFQTAIEMIQF